jgi:hypothetical protein
VPPVVTTRGYAPPPPPPLGWQQGQQQPGRRRTITVTRANGKKPGCGCVLFVLLVFVLPFAGIAAGIFGAIQGAIDRGVQDEGPLTIGVRGEGGIGSGDTDRWTMVGQEGQFRIQVFADGDFDPVVILRSAAGTQLGRDDDGGVTGRDSLLTATLQSGERYLVDVSGFGDSSGDYDILVEPASAPTPPIGEVIARGPLAIRSPVEGRVGEGDVDRYRFTGENREVVFTVAGIDGFDPMVTVRQVNGTELGSDDDGGEVGRDSRLAVTIPGGETVFVDVEGFNAQGGTYRLEAR